MKLNRHPLSKHSRQDISTYALIERCIANSDLNELENVEARLQAAVDSGLLPARGQTQTALIKVRNAIAKLKLNQLFGSSDVASISPRLSPAVLQHFPLS